MTDAPADAFAPYLTRWKLVVTGPAIHTHSSDLLPVQYEKKAAMLKIAHTAEEQTGNTLMQWLAGDGAAQVYAHDGPAILLERLGATPSLVQIAKGGQDDEATRILCAAAGQIHRPRLMPPPELVPLRRWFRSLEKAAPQGEILQVAWQVAEDLLAHPQEIVPLHGDIHHGNVLHSRRGWLAIDPKGLLGERGYDYANIFCNPDITFALIPGRLERQLNIAAEAAALDAKRLRRWVVAYAGLSAAWWLEDGQGAEAAQVLEIAKLALLGVTLPE